MHKKCFPEMIEIEDEVLGDQIHNRKKELYSEFLDTRVIYRRWFASRLIIVYVNVRGFKQSILVQDLMCRYSFYIVEIN